MINRLWVSGCRRNIWRTLTTVARINYNWVFWVQTQRPKHGLSDPFAALSLVESTWSRDFKWNCLLKLWYVFVLPVQELRSVLVVEQYFHILKTIMVIRSPVAAQSSVYPQGDHLGIAGTQLSCKSMLHIFA